MNIQKEIADTVARLAILTKQNAAAQDKQRQAEFSAFIKDRKDRKEKQIGSFAAGLQKLQEEKALNNAAAVAKKNGWEAKEKTDTAIVYKHPLAGLWTLHVSPTGFKMLRCGEAIFSGTISELAGELANFKSHKN